MKNKTLLAFILIGVLSLAIFTFSLGAAQPTPPSGPGGSNGPGMGGSGPGSGGAGPGGSNGQSNGPSMGSGPGSGTPPSMNDKAPMKDRLEELYSEKDKYIEQKRQCKEMAAQTNAEKGTCWTNLKPIMIGLLQKELRLTGMRLMQLHNQSINISNLDEIKTKLDAANATFANPDSSKEEIKAAAQVVEDTINDIEDQATQGNVQVLISQMDKFLTKIDSLTGKMQSKIEALKSSGHDVTDLESSLEEYKSLVNNAKQEIADAKVKYADIKNSQEVTQLAREIRDSINNAKKSLEKAIDKMKALSPQIDQSGGNGGNGGNNNSGSSSDDNSTGGTA